MLTIKAGNYVLATYEYAGNNGKLKKLTYGNGDYEEYVYDILDRLVSVKLNGVTEYVVKYDSNGRLYSLTESGSTHIYEYDSLDRLIRAWQENASGKVIISVENSYDDLGRASGSKYGDVSATAQQYSITYKEDCNLVDTYTMPYNKVNTYTYDEFERLVTKTHSSDVYTSRYSYVTDADGNTSSLVSQLDIDTNTSDACYTYAYNNLGYISSISKNGSVIASYTYDALGQLTTEINRETSRVYTYTYDKSGNITQKLVFDYSTGNILESFSYTYNNSSWGDLLTNYNGTAISYDAIGNPTNWRNAVSLSWEGRELQGITLSDTKSVTYGYNSSGVRTSRSYVEANGNTWDYTYVLDGSKIMRESVQAYTTGMPGAGMSYSLYYYYDDAGVASVMYNGTRYYYVKNLQGDVIGLVNGSGNYVVQYSYDAWGNIVSTTGTLASTLGQYNPFRYRGYYYDVETGFYYLQSRYYDPTVGRFLNADAYVSTGQGFTGNNMFAYCGNNPVIRADANGDFWLVLGCIVVGGVLLTRCTSDPNETLVGTHADPASDVYFSDKDKAIQYACDVAYTKMLDKFDETGFYHEYSIFVVRHNEAVYDSSLYYVTTEKSSGAIDHNYADYSILTDPDLSIVAWIHTHPTDKPDNHDYIFNENDMDNIDLYNVDVYVVEKSGTIWKLTKDKSNFTQEDKWGTARNRHSNGGTLCMIKSILYSY